MKRIEEIKDMDWMALEAASREVDVPDCLQERLSEAIAAHEAAREKPMVKSHRIIRWLPVTVAAAAAVVAVLVTGLNMSNRPKDTFDDPYLAYAQVEAAFRTISDKMSVGAGYAAEARAISEKPVVIMKKIQEK